MSEAYFPEVSGEDPQDRRTWRDRIRHAPRAVLITSLVAALAVGGAGVAFAAGSGSSSTNTPSSSSPTAAPNKSGAPHGPFARRGFGAFGALGLGGFGGGGVVHGQVTVRSGSSYKTIDIQIGQVTAASTTSITVKSTDGFSQMYTVTSATLVNSQAGGISSVTKGDQVSVEASVSGGTATATNIVDVTKIQGSRKAFGFAPPASNGSSSGSNGSSSGSIGSSSGSSGPAGATGFPGPGFGGGPGQPL